MIMEVAENVLNRQILIGCGILKKEVNWLIKKNDWPLDTFFMDSSLHINFEKLSDKLTSKLAKYSDKNPVVFYGACHPLMDKILIDANTHRTEGQNCVEMLVGNEYFDQELSNGAYFLLENWALQWDYICKKTFGDNKEIIQQIFREDRKYILALKTPCSGNFRKEGELMAQYVGLPLRWTEVELDILESNILSTLKQKNG